MLLLVQQGALLHELSHHTRPLMQASLQARHNDARNPGHALASNLPSSANCRLAGPILYTVTIPA